MRTRRHPMLLTLLVGVTLIAACADSDVRTDSAASRENSVAPTSPPAVEATASTEPVTTPVATTTPPTEAPDTAEPTTTASNTIASPTTSSTPSVPETTAVTGPVSTSSGDSLYPELGSADLDVVAYDVRLSYDPDSPELAGTVSMTAAVARQLDELAIDAVGLTIEAVEVDGAPADFRTEGNELIVTPTGPVGPTTSDAPTTIDVTYRDDAGAANATAEFPIGWFPTNGGSYVLNEPDGARTWMPSNDHPSDKATWRFEITVPTGLTAVANGSLIEQRDDPDGVTWIWEQREPMSTYLVQVLTGKYEVIDGGRASGVPIVHAALARDVERMQPYFDLTDDQIAFFEPFFGPYPLDRYGLAFPDSVPGLAMETQGRSFFSRSDFPGEVGYVQQLLLSHELAHQWFGNAVSPARWKDLWLNESFATYAEWMWLEEVGFDTVEATAEANLSNRQTPTEPTGQPTAASLFAYERYDGGAVVLHALRSLLGDENFFSLMRRWVAENDGFSRTTGDFVALAEEVGGQSLQAFRADWIDAARLPAEFPS